MLGSLKKRGVYLALVALLCVGGFFVWRAFFAEAPRPTFSGKRALADVRRQGALGPRTPGSAAHRRARASFVDTLRALADSAYLQPFTYTNAADTMDVPPGANVVATFTPGSGKHAEKRVLLLAHYDSRPWADEDPDAAKRNRPVPGANDGASGVAVLLEVARLLHAHPPKAGVDLVLLDLEDLGQSGAETDSTRTPFALGARHFAQQMSPDRYDYGILLDMVCDKNLRIPKEANSLRKAPAVVEKVWAAAREAGADAFVDRRGPAITDDHVPFLERGVPVVDLIHAPFPWYWHTTMDTPARCSAESLEQVGQTVLEVVYDE